MMPCFPDMPGWLRFGSWDRFRGDEGGLPGTPLFRSNKVRNLRADFYWTKSAWLRWGLCLMRPYIIWDSAKELTCPEHDMVADYLTRHSEARALYRPEQIGELKYYDILGMAEKMPKRDQSSSS